MNSFLTFDACNRREALADECSGHPRWHRLSVVFVLLVASFGSQAATSEPQFSATTTRWGIEEITLRSSKSYSNPFKDVELSAVFQQGTRSMKVAGFYDGDNVWRVRFMPDTVGTWTFTISSDDPSLRGSRGRFSVDPAVNGEHGPIQVVKKYHFGYADGTPYFLLGTTSYNWINRDAALQDETIHTLGQTSFNKLRFGLFPKWFDFNRVDPPAYPFVKASNGQLDLDRFDVAFFNNLERRVRQLQALGIQADIIFFHPYDNADRWGVSAMDPAHDEAYLKYVVARLAAFSNVWWTMANEYDIMPPNTLDAMLNRPVSSRISAAKPKDWDRLTQLVAGSDPYHHQLGIHNFAVWYDHSKPWISHAIIQAGGPPAVRAVRVARERYNKPAVIDEYGYEGNNSRGWGALTPTEEVARHWQITMAGGYASHGETYVHPGGRLAWAAGGTLVGESPARLASMKQVVTSMPFQDMRPARELVVNGAALAKPNEVYLFYFERGTESGGLSLPWAQVRLPDATLYKVDLIDPWLMQTYSLGFTDAGDNKITLPMTPSLLKFTVVPSGSGQSKSLQALLAEFAGDLVAEASADPSLFKDVPLHYSLDNSTAEIWQNAQATAVLSRFVPSSQIHGLDVVSPVFYLAKSKALTAEQVLQLEKELSAVEVR